MTTPRFGRGHAPLTALLGGVTLSPVSAADSIAVPPAGLAAGPWVASGWAEGIAVANRDGMQIEMSVRIPAEWDFYVDVDGQATGTWTHCTLHPVTSTGRGPGRVRPCTSEGNRNCAIALLVRRSRPG